MKIAMFTEMSFNGKVPRTHPNMRTEFAWMVAMGATHLKILYLHIMNKIENIIKD
jgi:hypothetical protein